VSSIVAEIEKKEVELEGKAFRAAKSIFQSDFGREANNRVEGLIRKFNPDMPSARRGKFSIRTKEEPKRVIAWAVAQRVKVERERQGLRQEDLAERAGIKRPNIARLEKGRHMPSVLTLQKVALALNLDMGSLLAVPMVSVKDMAEFTEMAEAGLEEWKRRLADEGRRK